MRCLVIKTCLLNTELKNIKQISWLQSSSKTYRTLPFCKGVLCAIPLAYLQTSSLKEQFVKLVFKETHTNTQTKKPLWKTTLGHWFCFVSYLKMLKWSLSLSIAGKLWCICKLYRLLSLYIFRNHWNVVIQENYTCVL